MIFSLAAVNIGLDPVILRLGGLAIHWYGLMYVVGILAGLAIALPYGEHREVPRDKTYELFWPILIGCLLGGRLYYVVQSDLGWYLRHPTQILATWEGGMAFYGAVFLGAATAFVACRLKRVAFAVLLDIAAVFIPVAQSFGRVGNIINGDIIGYPSKLPWAVRYTNPHNTFVPSHVTAYQPANIYELLFTLVLLALIWSLRFRFRVPGTLFGVWLITYSIGQFVLFFERANPVVLFNLKQGQLTAVAVTVIGVPILLWWRKHWLNDDSNMVPDRRGETRQNDFAVGDGAST